MDHCDAIEWIVDLLGTQELIAATTDAKVYADVRADAKTPGLYFFKGHWYVSKGGSVTDSYKLKYQISGTAHFCQTFATMIYLGHKLPAGKYADNIESAMDFWISFFSSQEKICEWFLNEIHTSKWKDHLVNIHDLTGKGNIALKNFTAANLLDYIRTVKMSAAHLTGCMEG